MTVVSVVVIAANFAFGAFVEQQRRKRQTNLERDGAGTWTIVSEWARSVVPCGRREEAVGVELTPEAKRQFEQATPSQSEARDFQDMQARAVSGHDDVYGDAVVTRRAVKGDEGDDGSAGGSGSSGTSASSDGSGVVIEQND